MFFSRVTMSRGEQIVLLNTEDQRPVVMEKLKVIPDKLGQVKAVGVGDRQAAGGILQIVKQHVGHVIVVAVKGHPGHAGRPRQPCNSDLRQLLRPKQAEQRLLHPLP